VTENQKVFSGFAPLLLIGGYFGLTFARSAGWIPESWSLIPVLETAWLNFLVVLTAILWMRIKKIPLSRVGLGAFQPSRTLFLWVIGIMAVDSVAVGIAAPVLTSVFGDAPQVARFADLPGNLPLLLTLLPVAWLIAAFGEEIFFRGFLMTTIAEVLPGFRQSLPKRLHSGLFTPIRDQHKRYPLALAAPFTVLHFYWQKGIYGQSFLHMG